MCWEFVTPSQGEIAWTVRDTSTNGTYLNDTKIGRDQTVPLREGDRLRLSNAPSEVLE